MTGPRMSNVTFSGLSNDVSHGFQTLSYDNSAAPVNSHEPCTVNQLPWSLPNNANSQGISHLSGNNTGVSNMSLSHGSNNITSGCQTVISHDACAVRPVPCSIPHHANTQFPCTPSCIVNFTHYLIYTSLIPGYTWHKGHVGSATSLRANLPVRPPAPKDHDSWVSSPSAGSNVLDPSSK